MARAIATNADRVPAAPLLVALRNPRVLTFVGVWFGLNLLFGLGSVSFLIGENQSVAWEAHVGGFLAGLLLFSLFDPVHRRRIVEDERNCMTLARVNRLLAWLPRDAPDRDRNPDPPRGLIRYRRACPERPPSSTVEEAGRRDGISQGATPMTVKAILSAKGSDVVTIEPTTNLAAAAKLLAERKIGALVVTGPDRRVVGIVSERDIVQELAAHGAAALDLPLTDVMTRKVTTCSVPTPSAR